MDIGTAILISSFVSLCGIIIVIELNNRNWFKRKNFLLGQQVEKIKLKKLERDLNIKPTKTTDEKTLLESVKGLDIDKIKNLLNIVQNDEDESETDNSLTSVITNLIENNPELVEKYAPELIKRFMPNNEQNEYIAPENR